MPSKSTKTRTLPPQPRNSRIIYQDDLRWDPKVNALWKSTLPGQRLPVDRAFGAEPEEVLDAYKRLQREERAAHAKYWRTKGRDSRKVDDSSLREWRKIQIEQFTMRGRSPEPQFYKGPRKEPSPSRDHIHNEDHAEVPDPKVESNPTIPHPKYRLRATKEAQSPGISTSSESLRTRRGGLQPGGGDVQQHSTHPYRSGDKHIPISPAGRARIPALPLRTQGHAASDSVGLENVPHQQQNTPTLDTDVALTPAHPSITSSLDLFTSTLDVIPNMLDAGVLAADHASAILDAYNEFAPSPFRYEDPEVYDKEREMDKGITSVDFSRVGL